MRGFLNHWLASLTRKPIVLHEHRWEKLAKLTSPSREVLDCSCGLRQIVVLGTPNVPEHTLVIVQGTSLDNVLINNSLL